ncbi:MAG TPA: hypothetical protein VHM25_14425 [Polyangiaceae bacterium]|nr:hypothetical protein [Polyangiaceae bacterium]
MPTRSLTLLHLGRSTASWSSRVELSAPAHKNTFRAETIWELAVRWFRYSTVQRAVSSASAPW